MSSPRSVLHLGVGSVAIALALTTFVPTSAQAARATPEAPTRTWGTNGRVYAALPVGDKVYVAGSFTAVTDTAGVSYPASRLAVFSPATGTFDRSWSAGADGSISTIAVASGQLYIGGSFTSVNGVPRKKLAKLNAATGAVDPSWTPMVNRPPDGLAVAGSNVYVGGPFTQAGNDGSAPLARPYVARFAVASGAVDGGWAPSPDGRVRVVRSDATGSAVFLGGDFTTVNGSAAARSLAKVSTTSGMLVSGFASGATNLTNRPPVFDINAGAAGRIYLAVGGAGGACVSMNDATGAVVWSKRSNGNIQAVSLSGSTVYCGGHFSGVGAFDGQTRFKLAAVDATSGATQAFAPRVNSALGVWTIAATPGQLFVGGDFTLVSGAAQSRFAQFSR